MIKLRFEGSSQSDRMGESYFAMFPNYLQKVARNSRRAGCCWRWPDARFTQPQASVQNLVPIAAVGLESCSTLLLPAAKPRRSMDGKPPPY